jgi:CheY-like chemotaxis protein
MSHGHTVETCENGNQSLERLKATANVDALRFDLVLTDLQMPVMDGFESTEHEKVSSVGRGTAEET